MKVYIIAIPLSLLLLSLMTSCKSTTEYYQAGIEAYDSRNAKKAAKMYRKAAEQNHADAQYKLASMYNHQQGIKRDLDEAAKWYHAAAEQGHPEAQYYLAHMYKEGLAVVRDKAKTVYWYRESAENGYPYAQHNLAHCYYHGLGVEKDNEEAIKWYTKAAEQNLVHSQQTLAIMLVTIKHDYSLAAKWFLKSAKQGYSDAQFRIALMYERGIGVPKDICRAYRWYNYAALQGHVSATVNRNNMKLTPEDYAKAKELTILITPPIKDDSAPVNAQDAYLLLR